MFGRNGNDGEVNGLWDRGVGQIRVDWLAEQFLEFGVDEVHFPAAAGHEPGRLVGEKELNPPNFVLRHPNNGNTFRVEEGGEVNFGPIKRLQCRASHSLNP